MKLDGPTWLKLDGSKGLKVDGLWLIGTVRFGPHSKSTIDIDNILEII